MEIIRVIENGKRKRGESHDDDRDRISELPHEILISIIPRLTLREAIATRILSSRWRCLCTNEYATHLNFPQFDVSNSDDDASLEDILGRRFRNYINMINQIVDSHKNPKVKEFKVQMHSLDGATIQKWLLFALSKQVEVIDINMNYYLTKARSVVYSFQLRILVMQLPLGLGSLKKLALSAIQVEDSEIDLLLSNSPQLESLSIAWSRRLTKVEVEGQPTSMLKHLEICHAVNLKSVVIWNMATLVSLKFHKLPPTFVLALDDVPKLVEFSTCDDDYGWILCKVFAGVGPSIFSQLHTLKICSSPGDTYPVMVPLHLLPVFKSVKHLELQYAPFTVLNDGFWEFLGVIRTFPSLEELKIKISWPLYTRFQEKDAENAIAPFSKGELFPSLKNMKFSGFLGNSAELMVVISILNNANSLEELIVEVCDITEKIRLLATARALEQIRPTLHHSTRLQVI